MKSWNIPVSSKVQIILRLYGPYNGQKRKSGNFPLDFGPEDLEKIGELSYGSNGPQGPKENLGILLRIQCEPKEKSGEQNFRISVHRADVKFAN